MRPVIYLTKKLSASAPGSYKNIAKGEKGNLFIRIHPRIISATYNKAAHRKTVSKVRYSAGYYRFFLPGDWDQFLSDFCSGDRYRNILDLHENKNDYTKSKRFNELINALHEDQPHSKNGYKLHTENGIHSYCQQYINMLQSMENEGYIPSLSQDSCKVAITRDGKFVKWAHNGFNRLSAAKILNIDEILVEVVRIHPIWAENCGGRSINSIPQLIQKALETYD